MFLIAIFFIRPELTADQRNVVRLLWALLAGFAAAFMGGAASIRVQLSRPITLAFSATGGLAVFALMYLVAPYWFTDERAAAAEVRTCMAQHGLKSAHEVRQQQHYVEPSQPPGEIQTYVEATFASCDWPRPSYAYADEYTEISLATVQGPEDNDATGADAADRIRSPCARLRLTYEYASQGGYGFMPPIEVSPRLVVRVDGRPYPVLPTGHELPFYPDPDEAVVVHNFKYSLKQASCLV